MYRNWLWPLVGLVALGAGCDGDGGTDAGMLADAATVDGGGSDAGGDGTDSGVDAGVEMTDAGSDAGAMTPDAGSACSLSIEGSISVPETIMARLSGAGENASTTCTSDMGAGGPDHIYTLEIASTTGVELAVTASFGVALAIRSACDDAIGELACGRNDAGAMPDTGRVRLVLEPGTYFVLVDTLGFGVGGDYTLTAAEFTPPSNTTCASAMSVAPGTVLPAEELDLAAMSASSCGAMPSNSLFYSVVIPANSGLSVTARPTMPAMAPRVEILDGCTSSMCLADDTTYANTTGSDQTVIVAVRGSGTLEVGFDLFRIAENASCATALSVMDGTRLAGERLSFGGGNPGQCFASLATDAMFRSLFYTVDVPAGELLGVLLSPTPPFEGLTVSLLDDCTAGATCLGSSGSHPPFPGSEGDREFFFANTRRTARTVVFAVSGAPLAEFDMSVTIGPAPTNTTCAMATPISDGTSLPSEFVGGATETLEGVCLPMSTGAVLYYSATVGAGETLDVRATPGALGGSTSVRILRRCGATGCRASGSGSARFENTGARPVNLIIAVGIDPDASPLPGISPPSSFSLDVSIGLPPYTETSITAACNDMSAATPLAGVTMDDSVSATTALPFAFDFFGDAVTHHAVSSNGVVQLFSSATGRGATTFTNTALPDAGPPDGFIAAFWDDLVPGTLVTTISGTAPDRVFTVQWTSFSVFRDATAAVTFQTQLYETSNVIELHYCTMTAGMDAARVTGSSATVGLEDASGALGFQHSFDTPDSVGTVNGIRFTPM